MPTIALPDRAVVAVSGPDAEHFLQNIVTADLADLPPDAVKPCALLTPQGKILFDFLVSKDGDAGFRLDVRADIADDFMRRLVLYRLRAKVDISKPDQPLVGARWEPDSNPSQTDSSASRNDSTKLRDLRFPDAAVFRIFGDMTNDARPADWDALRIAHGVAESGADYALGDAFPHDVLLDQNDGVGFRKGCYVGQEVVSRMQHRGTARRRVLIAAGAGPLPAPGTEITANGRSIGVLGTVAGDRALAIARIDKVKDAMDSGTPMLAGGVALTLAIPPSARFTFPLDAPSEDA
ncbi:MAG: folate-binding protein YgfZ [Mesorhizobium sp.]|nr:folate-binding protein YgfZ [Mesorhizobium sp.]